MIKKFLLILVFVNLILMLKSSDAENNVLNCSDKSKKDRSDFLPGPFDYVSEEQKWKQIREQISKRYKDYEKEKIIRANYKNYSDTGEDKKKLFMSPLIYKKSYNKV